MPPIFKGRIKSSIADGDSMTQIPDGDLFVNWPEPPTLPEAISASDIAARLQRRYADLITAYSASARLDVTREENELYREILLAAQSLCHAHGGSLMLREETSDELTMVASIHLAEHIVRSTRVKIGEGVVGWVAAYAQPLLLIGELNTSQYPGAVPKPQAIGSALCVPLVVRIPPAGTPECLGVLTLHRVVYSPALTEEDLQVVTAFGANAATAIHNARLYKVMQRHARHLAHLIEINRRLTMSLRLDQVLQAVMHAAVELLNCEAGSILLIDPETNELVFRVVTGPASEHLEGTRLPRDVGIAGEVVRTGKPLIVNNVQSDPRHYKEIDHRTSHSTLMLLAVPLVTRDRILGVIEVLNKKGGVPFNDEDCAALTALAVPSAIALENAQLYSDLRQAFMDTVRVIANAVEARDPYTAGHTSRVTRIASEIARELQWSREQLENLEIGALLHDIGKIGVPDMILRKPDSLTSDEYVAMQQHPVVGAQMLKGVSILQPALAYILYHHERYDGTGYPFGLSGKEIPIEGRLLTVADTFDAMTSDRPYRQALSHEEALAEIVRHRGTQFDPEIVDALLRAYEHGRLKKLTQTS